MPYRPNYEDEDGQLKDLPIEAETVIRLKTPRAIGLSGVTAVAKQFDGTANVTIAITAIPASLLTGTATVDTTGEAKSAKDYNSNEGSIKNKFDSVDGALSETNRQISELNTQLQNLGKIKIGTEYYSCRVTNDINDKGQAGYLTFII